jgi:hypothetical protein
MAPLRPTKTRQGFDEITQGWGSDGVEDLTARCELLVEHYRELGGYTAAELKIANAMERRLKELGGTMPIAKNTAKADEEAAAAQGEGEQ